MESIWLIEERKASGFVYRKKIIKRVFALRQRRFTRLVQKKIPLYHFLPIELDQCRYVVRRILMTEKIIKQELLYQGKIRSHRIHIQRKISTSEDIWRFGSKRSLPVF